MIAYRDEHIRKSDKWVLWDDFFSLLHFAQRFSKTSTAKEENIHQGEFGTFASDAIQARWLRIWLRSYYPGQKIETTTRTWHRRVICRTCTLLCLACVPVSIFLARVVPPATFVLARRYRHRFKSIAASVLGVSMSDRHFLTALADGLTRCKPLSPSTPLRPTFEEKRRQFLGKTAASVFFLLKLKV